MAMTDDMVREATSFTEGSSSSRAAAELSEAIDILRGNVAHLAERLAYVLEPHDSVMAEARQKVDVAQSPLTERLCAHIGQIHDISNIVTSLLRRLDLPA